jgi:chemotaxis protein histidine kinase CheA
MSVDPFTERLARIRERFIASLDSKIADTYAAIPNLASNSSETTETVAETYRRVHGIVGIGPTVGFAGTGRAARHLEDILMEPHQAERGLTAQEIINFKKALHTLRETAAQELQSFYSGWR